MKPPPLLMGAGLLLWGWQCEMLLWGVLIGLLIEVARLIPGRWEFSTTDLNRVWDLCVVLCLGAGVLAYTSQDAVQRALSFFQWQPIVFLPMVLAQTYGTTQRIPLGVFSWFLRKRPDHHWARQSINFCFLYFAMTLVAASAANRLTPWFYPAIVSLVAVALVSVRPIRLPLLVWVGMIALIGVGGYVGQQQLHALQPRVEASLAYMLYKIFRRDPDTREARTAIGQIGQIKLSGKIVMRLQAQAGSMAPELLREASYDSFSRDLWRASSGMFNSVPVDASETAMLGRPKHRRSEVRIWRYLSGGRGLLALPHGTYELREFPAILETNRLGVARVDSGPGLLEWVAAYSPDFTWDGPKTGVDTTVPDEETAALREIAEKLDLKSKSEGERVRAIGQFFANNFHYSTYLPNPPRGRSGEAATPMGEFLLHTRSGHCEYFGSATVLLLRYAGIPARYATGYAVQENARRDNTYIIRERHAHAWAIYYDTQKGLWEDLDTTPGGWGEIESERASGWEGLSDLWANLKFQFLKWYWGKDSYGLYLRWALVPLVLLLAWRIFFRRRRRSLTGAAVAMRGPLWPGRDSEFYQMYQRLEAAGWGRAADEPLGVWENRVAIRVPESDRFREIVRLHRRLRFDPKGLSEAERQQLRDQVQQWGEAWERSAKET